MKAPCSAVAVFFPKKDGSLAAVFVMVRRIGLFLAAIGIPFITFLFLATARSYEAAIPGGVFLGLTIILGCGLIFGSTGIVGWVKTMVAAIGYVAAGSLVFWTGQLLHHDYGPRTTDEKEASALKQIVVKVLIYVGHDAALAESVRGKSINELVLMNVLSPADAAFLKEHEVKFYGFDHTLPPEKTTVFDKISLRRPYRLKILCYGDAHASSFLLIARVPESNPAYRSSGSLGTNDTSRDLPLGFLMDLPSLKGVSLGMPEAELLKILALQNLSFDEGFQGDETSYTVRTTNDSIVFFTLRNGRCTGIERLRRLFTGHATSDGRRPPLQNVDGIKKLRVDWVSVPLMTNRKAPGSAGETLEV